MCLATPAPVTYSGRRDKESGRPFVYRGSVRMDASRSLLVRNHSPDGFDWGYQGSGPAQLALALLLDAVDDVAIAERHYQDFKREIVSAWSDTWDTTPFAIWQWLGYDGTNAESLRNPKRA